MPQIPFSPVVPLLNGNIFFGSVSITRPNNTTLYTVGDIVADNSGGAVFKIAVGRNTFPGDNNGIIRAVRVASPDIAQLRLHFSSAAFAAADNAAMGLTMADLPNLCGSGINVTTASAVFGNYAEVVSSNQGLTYALPAGQTDLYLGLSVVTGYTPTANAVYRVDLWIDRS